MSQSIETKNIQPDDIGISRRASSVAATLASNHSIDNHDKNEAKLKETDDQISEHTIADTEEKPKKKNNIFITFSGLQLALFLAALDRYINKTEKNVTLK